MLAPSYWMMAFIHIMLSNGLAVALFSASVIRVHNLNNLCYESMDNLLRLISGGVLCLVAGYCSLVRTRLIVLISPLQSIAKDLPQ